jgi:hypothetical protein
LNIIIADDEILTRRSAIRILKNCAMEIGIKLNIIEAEDGIETIFIIYRAWSVGINISMIISDENMIFLNGVKCSQILYETSEKKKKIITPFYLLTAYEDEYLKASANGTIKIVISKPLTKDMAIKILKSKSY